MASLLLWVLDFLIPFLSAPDSPSPCRRDVSSIPGSHGEPSHCLLPFLQLICRGPGSICRSLNLHSLEIPGAGRNGIRLQCLRILPLSASVPIPSGSSAAVAPSGLNRPGCPTHPNPTNEGTTDAAHTQHHNHSRKGRFC